MVLHRYWNQNEPLQTLGDEFFNDELTEKMFNFIMEGTYKNYYSNHVVIEIHRNTARLFNKNTEEYIGIGFFNTKEDGKENRNV